VFTQDEVWNGAYVQENGRRVPICNWFDEERDAWFDLDLENESGVVLRRGVYERRGAVGHWLTSEAFDLLTDRGSVEAEQVVLRARELLSGEDPSLDEVEEVGRELGKVLSDSDPFLAG
jgi:hypothetical protein